MALRSGAEIQVGGIQRMDFTMTLGAVSEQVEVTSAEPLLTSESVALGSVIGTKQIVQLPLNGHDYLSLVQLSPNVVTEAASTGASSYEGGVRASESISIAGQRLEFNYYTLDGVENTDPNFNSYIIHPSVDALQEFSVQAGVYSAEFGKGAAQINATTRVGTNSYHLVAFEFVRSSIFDADSWRQQGRKDPFHRNDAGFTLDGPLFIPGLFNGKDRLFFMSNFEILRDRLTQQILSSVPTAAMRTGNLADYPQIYDPLTRVYTGSTTGTATPFQGNMIPTNRISPAALALLNYDPLPNVPGTSLLNNYVRQAATPTDETGTLKATGEFDFDGQSTNNPGITGTGFIFADFLLGYPSQSYRVAQLANAQLRRTSYVGYFQDDWKVTPKITINVGLRYENTRPWHDKYTQLINVWAFPLVGCRVEGIPLPSPRLCRELHRPFSQGPAAAISIRAWIFTMPQDSLPRSETSTCVAPGSCRSKSATPTPASPCGISVTPTCITCRR